jgi:hypothetical protein
MRWGLALAFVGWLIAGTNAVADAATLGAGRLAPGVFAGYDRPTGQADAEEGFVAGVRVRIGLLRNLEIEPSVGVVENRDATTETGARIPSPGVIAASVNGLYKARVWRVPVYLTAGTGWTRLDLHGGGGTSNDLTFNVGAAIEHGLGPVQLDLGPRYFVTRTASGASRKHLAVILGLTYALP